MNTLAATSAGGSSGIRTWFKNPADGRLRAGWRIGVFVLVFMGLAIAGQLGLRAILGGFPKGSPLIFPVLAVAATLAVLFARRFLDRRSFVSLGLSNRRAAVADIAFGFCLSGLMAALVFLLMWQVGAVDGFSIDLSGPALVAILGVPLAVTILVGYWEELVFRGYLLQNMADGMGMKWAVVVSCLLYGLVHAMNPHASVLSSAIIVLFGFLRIYGYLATGLLWLSMGMHIGWNYFQGVIFGFAASGQGSDVTLLSPQLAGPAWLSGGDFGPEASVLIIPVLLVALWLMRAWARWRAPHRQGLSA